MSSSYSELKIQLMVTGENDGTWGDITNQNFLAFQQMITGSAAVPFNSAPVTLPFVDTNSPQAARALRLVATGLTGAGQNLTVPDLVNGKLYLVGNSTDGPVTVRNPTGPSQVVPVNRSAALYAAGAGVFSAIDYISDLRAGVASTDGNLNVGGALIVNLSLQTGGFIVADTVTARILQNNSRGVFINGDGANYSTVVWDTNVDQKFVYDFASHNLYYGDHTFVGLIFSSEGSLSVLDTLSAGGVAVGGSGGIVLNVSAGNYSQLHMQTGATDYDWHFNFTSKRLSWFANGSETFFIEPNGNVAVQAAFNASSVTTTGDILARGLCGILNNNHTGPILSGDGVNFGDLIMNNVTNFRLRHIYTNGDLTWYNGATPLTIIDKNGNFSAKVGMYNAGGLYFQTGLGFDPALTRVLQFLQGAEAGGNAGNDLTWNCYSNTGAFLAAACQVKRSTQRMLFFGGNTVSMSVAVGGNIQYKLDGVTRWMQSFEANSGNYSILALDGAGNLAAEFTRYHLDTFNIEYGNNVESRFLKATTGAWFSGSGPIRLLGSGAGIIFQGQSQPATAAIGQANGLSTLYMAKGDGTPAPFIYDIGAGVGYAVAWNATSDVRLKYDIAPLASGLNALAALSPVTYMATPTEQDATDRINGTFSAGIIAQDLIGTPFEGLVGLPKDDGFGGETHYSYNYAGMTAWFIAAFKEVKAKLEATEATLADLLARVAALENP